MLVEFSCGCIGLINIQGDERPVIIHPCDINGPECWEPLRFTRRDMQLKGHKPLPPEDAVVLLDSLNSLLNDGYRFRQMKALFEPL